MKPESRTSEDGRFILNTNRMQETLHAKGARDPLCWNPKHRQSPDTVAAVWNYVCRQGYSEGSAFEIVRQLLERKDKGGRDWSGTRHRFRVIYIGQTIIVSLLRANLGDPGKHLGVDHVRVHDSLGPDDLKFVNSWVGQKRQDDEPPAWDILLDLFQGREQEVDNKLRHLCAQALTEGIDAGPPEVADDD